jgi:hypothetical protein
MCFIEIKSILHEPTDWLHYIFTNNCISISINGIAWLIFSRDMDIKIKYFSISVYLIFQGFDIW